MRYRYNSLLIISLLFFVVSTIMYDGTAFSRFPGDMRTIYFTDSIKTWGNDSLKKEDDLVRGKMLYEKKCQKCHGLYDPSDFKLKIWKENLREMRQKAELSNEEYNLILGYLSKNCEK